MGDSRFDLLLGNKAVQFPVEVKSCTLFGKNGAMFPDAVTARGRKHVLHLGDIGKNGGRAGLLVLVQWDRARWFLPDYHTDPEFAEAFRSVAPYIDWKAAALQWTPDFTVPAGVRLLPSPLEILDQESGNRGDYLLVLHLDTAQDIEIGSRGILHFPERYYVYIGSARKNLDQRMARHRRLRKGMHWHIDWLRRKQNGWGASPSAPQRIWSISWRLPCPVSPTGKSPASAVRTAIAPRIFSASMKIPCIFRDLFR